MNAENNSSVEVILNFFIHVLAVFGSMALAHHFFPGSTIWMFFIVLFGVLLINWHRTEDPRQSVIGLIILAAKRGKTAVRSSRPAKAIDDLPPEK